jgi:hypothetical protein
MHLSIGFEKIFSLFFGGYYPRLQVDVIGEDFVEYLPIGASEVNDSTEVHLLHDFQNLDVVLVLFDVPVQKVGLVSESHGC